ncbi:hypothetical protein GCM10018980_53010 [Streptomyces capoamus]|uniref:Uncharacterized protein n=2 Tax=Streptomyces capoamus TaxID=68183 RepID=A0A919F070_9ACTN|nr:hypothetical protein GCM10010501_42880 [Streptomyces libani subsp. rufus]GHG62900.1 hypothetical protein GCM10018980_53010 [Streptomyces capoamus]
MSRDGGRDRMDAYDEDPRGPHGPDGPAGARLPEEPREPSPEPPPAPDPAPAPAQAPEPAPAPRPAPAPEPEPAPVPASPPSLPPRTGVAALSPRYQVGAALALAVVAVAACTHLLMVFLSLAPANTVTKQHGKAIEEWVYPEFEQNWKLFAPNPLQQNIAVQVRAEVRMRDGASRTTGWTDLSAQDGAAIDGNPVPSHTQQNELRRAWDFFAATHGTDNRPVGLRGSLSEQYLRRIVVMRLYRDDPTSREGVIQRVQIRSSTTNVQPPPWSGERVSDKPVYRLLPWWSLTSDEAAGGVR